MPEKSSQVRGSVSAGAAAVSDRESPAVKRMPEFIGTKPAKKQAGGGCRRSRFPRAPQGLNAAPRP
jgi:hypothetical protein